MGRSVIVVGGGASGIAAGIAAARAGADVTILEHMAKAGKKILVTGNGRCNLTNLVMPEGAYRGENPGFVKRVLDRVTVKDTLEFFDQIGIMTMNRNGYVYPNSGQASSVLEALMLELSHQGVKVVYDCEAERIKKDLSVVTNQGTFRADAVILAAGSMAAPNTGSDGSGYRLAGKLGHRVIKPLPALVQLRCREKFYKQLSGVRAEGDVRLLVDGNECIRDRGEVQFTDYGISGIPVFQVSRYAARALEDGKAVRAEIDLMPELAAWQVGKLLTKRVQTLGHLPQEEFLNGVFPGKLSAVLLKQAKITGKGAVRDLKGGDLNRLAQWIKSFTTEVLAANSFDKAQVCSGGVDTKEVNPETMESNLIKGLYLAGELLDVDGICGGYNLQWAWSSGILAGQEAGKRK